MAKLSRRRRTDGTRSRPGGTRLRRIVRSGQAPLQRDSTSQSDSLPICRQALPCQQSPLRVSIRPGRNRGKRRWGGRWGSNPRRPESQSGALPAELRPPLAKSNYIGKTSRRARQPSADGAPGRARTCDPRLRRPVLYPAELRAHVSSACWVKWSGRRDSNPRPSAPKADALPDCATPRQHSANRTAAPF